MSERIRITDLRDEANRSGIRRSADGGIYARSASWADVRALLDTAEAAHEARQLVADAIAAVPVRDANRDAHTILEHARQSLNRATARFDFGEKR